MYPDDGTWTSGLTHLECGRCGERYDADVPQNVCRCGSPLLARYDLDRVRASVRPADIAARGADLWRYRELLPVRDPANVTTLGEGWTPIVPLTAYGRRIGVPGLLAKDEGMLPTGSFKARGAAVGVSRARELGLRHLTLPTNGNAGAAWATYAARAETECLVVMPQDAPQVTRKESLAAGARVYLVDGLIGDAGRIAGQAVRHGWFSAATLREPYRIEGKKTMGLEIAEQFGWRVPDVVVYPTGGGVGLIGIRKALDELAALGWITGRLPRFVAVQASGCAPIVRAFASGAETAEPWPADQARTVAFGINVGAALGDFLILSALRDSKGTAVAVDDRDILAEQAACAAADGVLMCPEGAATLAAVRRLRADGWLGGDEEVLVLNTGSALKYEDSLQVGQPPLLARDADLPPEATAPAAPAGTTGAGPGPGTPR
ncbi:threonine synthase [Actinacidiphila sp. ITFR-21]|uniref:threonine synthase n=1 Tax=Actinacidiphila sp. ITFR-21 TaxID=3075199 RepID=UPI00288BFBD5|nr:threonine synthase [Streptomyces sp. ITFR-21]WNI16030.1 threonine synthase [Streptomyces sp. ITFR-21]